MMVLRIVGFTFYLNVTILTHTFMSYNLNDNMKPVSNLTYFDVMAMYKASNTSEAHQYTKIHLTVLSMYHGGDVRQLRLLYNQHSIFLFTGLNNIRQAMRDVRRPSDIHTLLEIYDFLIKCLKRLVPVLEIKAVLYDHWAEYIKFLTARRDYSIVRTLIPEFICPLMGSLGIVNNTRSLVPRYSTYTRDHHEACKPLLLMDIIGCYIECLSQSNLGVDFSRLVDVMEDINEWLWVFDGDMARRKWLVKCLMQKIEFDDEEASAKLFGVSLVEQAKVCKLDDNMVRLGVKLVIEKKIPCLIEELKHLANKFEVELEDLLGTKEWCIKQLQLLEERGYVSRVICKTIESIISYRLLEGILQARSSHLLLAMNVNSNVRHNGAGHYLANLNQVIDMLDMVRESNVDNTDHGPLDFLRGQALCLRGLSLYEEKPEAFIGCVLVAFNGSNITFLCFANGGKGRQPNGRKQLHKTMTCEFFLRDDDVKCFLATISLFKHV